MTIEPAKPADMAKFDALMANWFPLTNALNTLNRDMGLADLYPFALSDPVVGKLRFAHEVLQGAGTKGATIWAKLLYRNAVSGRNDIERHLNWHVDVLR